MTADTTPEQSPSSDPMGGSSRSESCEAARELLESLGFTLEDQDGNPVLWDADFEYIEVSRTAAEMLALVYEQLTLWAEQRSYDADSQLGA